MDQGSHGSRGHLTHRARIGLAYAFSLATTYLLLQPEAKCLDGTPSGGSRGYLPEHQLTYAGIASTTASRNFSFAEPFTETGTFIYSSLWRRMIRALPESFGAAVPTMLTLWLLQ